MKGKKEIQYRMVSTLLDYFYWFFMGNLYFALCNIPLLYMLFVSSPPRSMRLSVVEIYLCCLPVGPAFTALSGCMGKMLRDKDVNITKDFFKTYKANFKQSILLWAAELAVILVLYVDLKSSEAMYSVVYIFLLLIVCTAGFYIFPIIARFHMKSRDVIVVSIHCVVRRFKTTMGIVLSIMAGALVFYILPGIAILFIASFVCYCTAYYQKDMLKALENGL